MPKFVPVTNPELARNEQDQDADMAKHRAWESKQYVQENRTGDNLTPGVGSMQSIAFTRKVTGKQKMVRNDKGLWVKVEDENPAGSAAPAPEAVAKVGMTGGGRGLGSRDEFGQRKSGSGSSIARGRNEFGERVQGQQQGGKDKDDRSQERRGREDREREDSRRGRDGHRDRRDRSPGRDRHRDRRSRSRDRHRSRDSRSRSRERQWERRRSRSRDRDRRRQKRSRSREKRSRSRDRHKEKRRSRSRDGDMKQDGRMQGMGMTAAQLSTMLCEIWRYMLLL